MVPLDPARLMARYLMWYAVVNLYLACLSPILMEGLTISSIGGVLCMGIIVTYVLTRISGQRSQIEDGLAHFIRRIMP